MQSNALPILLLLAAVAPARSEAMNPIQKVLSMISDLETKTIAEGEAEQKTYHEFAEVCEERSKQLDFQIKTGKADAAALQATIDKAMSDSEAFKAKIEELAGAIATDEADLKAATEIRAKEASDFAAEERDLQGTIDELTRAATILEREMQGGPSMIQLKGGGSMMHLKSAKTVAQAFSIMVEASAMSGADAKRLMMLIQNSSLNDDKELGAPAGSIYESQSGGILGTLEDLAQKAEDQLAEARQTETSSIHAFQLLRQTLEDEIKYGNKDLDRVKKNLAAAGETKATAEGDLAVTSKTLEEDQKAQAELHTDCFSEANRFELAVKSRGEELKALATAKKAIEEHTVGATAQTYGGATARTYSFLQQDKYKDPASQGFAAVHFVRRLAEKQHSVGLSQLASRMSQAVHAGDNPFAKVKGLIMDMIEKLQSEAESDADHKAFCDKELAESNAKKDDHEAEISKLSTKIDLLTAESNKLKEEVTVHQKDLAALAKMQLEMDNLRNEEKAEFETAKADLEQGIDGIKLALKILRDYYAAEASHEGGGGSGTGEGIISMLEVVESDFTKGLQERTANEDKAVAIYTQQTKENAIEKATTDQDVKYKTKEAKRLDQMIADLSTDRSSVQRELDAVNEYLTKLKLQCVAKAEPYEERKVRREAEIAGLKEALQILEGEAVLLQNRIARSTLRGARK